MNLKASHLWRMINYDSHELLWQRIKIAVHHLFLISSFSMSDLILIYFLQLHYFDICASTNVSFFLRKNVNILKSSCDSFLLQIIEKNSCKNTIFNQIYIISYRLFVQIWKNLIIKISAEKKIKYQIIKHTN